MEKILDCQMRSIASNDLNSSDNVVKQYLVKWKGLSYLHCSWYLPHDFMLCLNMLSIMFMVVLSCMPLVFLYHLFLSFLGFANHRVPAQEFQKAYKFNPRLVFRVIRFHSAMESMSKNGDDFVAIHPEWTTVDRVIDCRLSDGTLFFLFIHGNSGVCVFYSWFLLLMQRRRWGQGVSGEVQRTFL